MKIEVTHIIKADESLLSIFGAVISALTTQSENLTVADAVKLAPTEDAPKQTKPAEKATPAKTEKVEHVAVEKTDEPEEKAPTEEADPVTHNVTMVMLRAEAAKLTSKGRQADFKALLTSMGSKKLSEVPEEKYPELHESIKKAIADGEA